MDNVDATVFHNLNRMGLGLVIRDHRGESWLLAGKALIG